MVLCRLTLSGARLLPEHNRSRCGMPAVHRFPLGCFSMLFTCGFLLLLGLMVLSEIGTSLKVNSLECEHSINFMPSSVNLFIALAWP